KRSASSIPGPRRRGSWRCAVSCRWTSRRLASIHPQYRQERRHRCEEEAIDEPDSRTRLARTQIFLHVLAERLDAIESVQDLAFDSDLTEPEVVEDAIRTRRLSPAELPS